MASISFPSLSRRQGPPSRHGFFLSINTNRAFLHNVQNTPANKHAFYICSSTPGHWRAITCSTSARMPLGPGAIPVVRLFTATISSFSVKRGIASAGTSIVLALLEGWTRNNSSITLSVVDASSSSGGLESQFPGHYLVTQSPRIH